MDREGETEINREEKETWLSGEAVKREDASVRKVARVWEKPFEQRY